MKIIYKKTVVELIQDSLDEIWTEHGEDGIKKISHIEVTEEEFDEILEIHGLGGMLPSFGGLMFVRDSFIQSIEILIEEDDE